MKTTIFVCIFLTAVVADCSADRPVVRSDVPTIQGSDIKRPLTYREQLESLLLSNTSYPKDALRRGEQGTCQIKIEYARDGAILSSQLIQTTGYNDLDVECLAVIGRITRFPALPDNVATEAAKFTVVLPIAFHLLDKN